MTNDANSAPRRPPLDTAPPDHDEIQAHRPGTITNDWILDNFTIVAGRGDARHLMDKREPDTERVRDTGNALRALHTDPDTARAITLLAKEKGWDGIQVKGSQTFKQQVWFEANKLGLAVKGYTPTEQDKTALAHIQAATTPDVATRLQQRAHQQIAGTVYDTPKNRKALNDALNKRMNTFNKDGRPDTERRPATKPPADIEIGQ